LRETDLRLGNPPCAITVPLAEKCRHGSAPRYYGWPWARLRQQQALPEERNRQDGIALREDKIRLRAGHRLSSKVIPRAYSLGKGRTCTVEHHDYLNSWRLFVARSLGIPSERF
jgi:hypothetical protein